MARKVQLNLGSTSIHSGFATSFALVLSVIVGVCSNQVQVPERVSAVLGKNITLGCRVEVGSNLSLTQISWERRMPSGIVTLAVFNPVFGISVSDDYRKRVSFLQPSAQDASIILQGVAFADVGLYTCKVATFPLGNTQASTTLDIMVEPKVYVSAGARVLLDGGAEVVVATCTAERGRPAAEVLWESELPGHSEPHSQDEPNGTTTTMVRYTWAPTRLAQGRPITCVVRHPALPTEFRIPYVLDVQFAPDVTVAGYNGDWIVGQANRRLECRANANPAASHFIWTRLDGQMSEGVEVINGSLLFVRPLERNDSGIYRCEAQNDIGMRSYDLSIWIHEPPPTTAVSTATAAASPGGSFTSAPPNNRRAHFTSPTLPPPAESSLGTVVGGAVGGVLFLLLLLILGGVCYMRQRRTFRGDYYTKQYMGHSDMQKEAQLDVLQPHELKDVFGDKGSQDLKPKPDGDIIYPIDYPGDRGDGEWGDSLRLQNDGGYYPEPHSPHSTKPGGTPSHSPTLNNGSPYLREDCYDNGGDGDYVAHVDGSVISRREWYV